MTMNFFTDPEGRDNSSSSSVGDYLGEDHQLFVDLNISLFNSTESPFGSQYHNYNPAPRTLLFRAKNLIAKTVVPAICFIGLLGNIMSVVLISRDGVRKSSNILLIALALSDTTVLLGNAFWAFFESTTNGILSFSKGVNTILFHLYRFFVVFLLNTGFVCSYDYVMFITIERLCAIFFPLKFHLILTPTRTLLIVLVIAAASAIYPLCLTFALKLGQPFMHRRVTIVMIQPNSFYVRNQDMFAVAAQITNEFTGTFAIAFLVLGSAVIGYKVKVAAIRRARMVQADPDKVKKASRQSRTTKTLLAVCVTFVSLAGAIYIYDWLAPYLKKEVALLALFVQIKKVIFIINCSCNFFIYILSNDKFKDQLVAILCHRGDMASRLKARGKLGASVTEDSTKAQ